MPRVKPVNVRNSDGDWFAFRRAIPVWRVSRWLKTRTGPRRPQPVFDTAQTLSRACFRKRQSTPSLPPEPWQTNIRAEDTTQHIVPREAPQDATDDYPQSSPAFQVVSSRKTKTGGERSLRRGAKEDTCSAPLPMVEARFVPRLLGVSFTMATRVTRASLFKPGSWPGCRCKWRLRPVRRQVG